MTGNLDVVALLLYVGIGIVSPFLVDIITKRFANDKVKQVSLLAIHLLTGVAVGFYTAHQSGLIFDWKTALGAAAFSFIGGAAAVAGFKPVDLIGQNGLLAGKAGIGSVDPAKVANAVSAASVTVDAPVVATDAPVVTSTDDQATVAAFVSSVAPSTWTPEEITQAGLDGSGAPADQTADPVAQATDALNAALASIDATLAEAVATAQ